MKLSKNRKKSLEKLENGKVYTLEEASSLIKEVTLTKFDASVDLHVRLGVDPKNADEKALLDRLYGVQGFVEAKMSDFADVANIAARYGFVKKPQVFARPVDESAKDDAKGGTP